jgi:hypothetical protein
MRGARCARDDRHLRQAKAPAQLKRIEVVDHEFGYVKALPTKRPASAVTVRQISSARGEIRSHELYPDDLATGYSLGQIPGRHECAQVERLKLPGRMNDAQAGDFNGNIQEQRVKTVGESRSSEHSNTSDPRVCSYPAVGWLVVCFAQAASVRSPGTLTSWAANLGSAGLVLPMWSALYLAMAVSAWLAAQRNGRTTGACSALLPLNWRPMR